MKKILGIILAICCLGSVFAVMPSTTMSIVTFDGDAGLKFEQKLDYVKGSNEFGFGNWATAKINIKLLNGGEENTKGKGVWGEIKVGVESAETGDKTNENVGNLSIGKKAEISTAKIHFYKGDVDVALNIKPSEAKLGNLSLASAVPGSSYQTSEINKAYKNGFGIEIRNYLADLDLIYNTNGVQKKEDLKQSFVANTTLKGFINTNLYGGVALKDKDFSYRLGADYTQDLANNMYVKPAIDFNLEAISGYKVSRLVFGGLFGFGDKDQNPGFTFDSTDKAEYNEGVSIGYETTLSKHDFANGVYGKVVIAAFENSLVPGLNTAVKYETKVEEFGKGALTLNTIYSKDFGIVGLTLEGQVSSSLTDIKGTSIDYRVALWNNVIVKNTTIEAKYIGKTSVDGKTNTGAIEVYAKVHF